MGNAWPIEAWTARGEDPQNFTIPDAPLPKGAVHTEGDATECSPNLTNGTEDFPFISEIFTLCYVKFPSSF